MAKESGAWTCDVRAPDWWLIVEWPKDVFWTSHEPQSKRNVINRQKSRLQGCRSSQMSSRR